MANKRDYYEVLGVSKNATDDEIKKAYRKKAKACHPDLHPDDKEAVERFKELNEANEVLSDPQKRARYDQFGFEIKIVDDEGVIRLQKKDGHVAVCKGSDWSGLLPVMVDRFTDYSDGGKTLPNIYVISGTRIVDLSGLDGINSVMSLAGVELAGVDSDDDLILLCSSRGD